MKHYISAARLRTLPLSVSGIIVGSGIALFQEKFNITIFILAILTTIGFQVLSNFANDYGDGVKGTDKNRIGEKRLVASGKITPKQMKSAMQITAIITLFIALLLIYKSFGKSNFIYSATFLFLGIASIVAAIKYTVGKLAYGYSGLGDVFVFLFFGLLSVVGSSFLFTKNITGTEFLPATTVGLLSVAVLNLNNMRDVEFDKKSNKNTIVVKLGVSKAKQYHYLLILFAFITSFVYTLLNYQYITQFLFVLAFIPIVKHLLFIIKNKEPKKIDAELKKVALSTFLYSILFVLGLLY